MQNAHHDAGAQQALARAGRPASHNGAPGGIRALLERSTSTMTVPGSMLALGCSLLQSGLTVAAASTVSSSSLPGALREHNPHNVTVTKIHMVLSSHFDVGAKTAGCGVTRPGEPRFCARVIPNLPKHPGGMGEPYGYQILNRYFDEFLPDAIANAAFGRTAGVEYRCLLQSICV